MDEQSLFHILNAILAEPETRTAPVKLTGEIFSKQSGEIFISGVKQIQGDAEKCLKVRSFSKCEKIIFGCLIKYIFGLKETRPDLY